MRINEKGVKLYDFEFVAQGRVAFSADMHDATMALALAKALTYEERFGPIDIFRDGEHIGETDGKGMAFTFRVKCLGCAGTGIAPSVNGVYAGGMRKCANCDGRGKAEIE